MKNLLNILTIMVFHIHTPNTYAMENSEKLGIVPGPETVQNNEGNELVNLQKTMDDLYRFQVGLREKAFKKRWQRSLQKQRFGHDGVSFNCPHHQVFAPKDRGDLSPQNHQNWVYTH